MTGQFPQKSKTPNVKHQLFAVRDDGRWIWLETNPNGQWAFVDEPTRREIATALAEHLQQGATR